MFQSFKFFLIPVMVLGMSLPVNAQVTTADYQRADTIVKLNEMVYHQVASVNWIDSTHYFWYQVKTRAGLSYTLADAQKGIKRQAFDMQKLVEKLNVENAEKTSVKNIQIQKLSFDLKANKIHFVYNKKYWSCFLKNYRLTLDSVVKPEVAQPYWNENFDELGNKPVTSPDGQWIAFLKNNNVFVHHPKDNKDIQLSYDGSAGDYYSSYFSWSPDSKKLAVNKIRKNEDHYIYFVESSPKNQLQPILQKRYYLKPGDALPVKRPSLFDLTTLKQIQIDTRPFENQYDLSFPKWNQSSTAFTFDFNQRGHQVYQVAQVDASTGAVRVIIDEQSKTFIDYSGKYFRYDLDSRGEIIWASERDGWNHLYLYDVNTGMVKCKITTGNWVVREVVKVDEKNNWIIFKGSGRNTGEDPYFVHYYKVNFDGSGLTDLTPERMNHEAVFAADYSYFTDTYSSVQIPPVTVLRQTSDGALIMKLDEADVSELLAKGWMAPEPFVAKGRDGKTDIWGNIYRPTHFDPNKKYPVIEYIYAGPQSSFAQKSFKPCNYAFSGLAELGFIIVQVDGMGTSNRGKAFHDVCFKNLKDAGFPDRILWIKAAAEKYSYMDTTRVGLFGGSAGGQNTLSGLLFYSEFYKAGASSCGCHDNRMDKMWWNEQWMGYPIGPQYAECSNVDNAYRLQGKLLLIVGEVDDNVDPASTMQVVNALVKANKNFELVVLPGVNHTLGGDFGEQKRRDFFVRNLLGINPPEWYKSDNKK